MNRKVRLSSGIIILSGIILGAQGALLHEEELQLPPTIESGVWRGFEIEYVRGEAIIKARSGVDLATFDTQLENANLSRKRSPTRRLVVGVKLAIEDSTLEIIERLERSGVFEWAEPNVVYYADSIVPDDTYFERQWNLNNTGQVPPGGVPDADIDAIEGWVLEKGDDSRGRIAVLDSGIPRSDAIGLTHPDLTGSKFILREDYVQDSEDLRDIRGHGSHITGIIAANADNNEGVTGLSWYNEILVYKLLDNEGRVQIDYFDDAVYDALDYGAKVINCS
jgi:subtilisin family serine protease